MGSENTTPDATEAVAPEAEVTRDATPSEQNETDKQTPLKELPADEQIEILKDLNKKQEKRAKDNHKQAQANLQMAETAQSELAATRRENAFLKLKVAHPELSDDALALCDKTDPDEILAWGEKAAGIFGAKRPDDSHEDSAKPETRKPNSVLQRFDNDRRTESNTPSGKTGQPSFNEMRKKRLEQARAKYSHKNNN